MKSIKEIYRFFHINNDDETMVDRVEDDSRNITKGDLFIAIEKGNDYIEEAISKGAKAILSDKLISDLNNRLLEFVLWFYDYPQKDLTLIGVTGTNGKTSTAYFLYQLLPKAFLVSNVYNNNKNIGYSINTTPTPVRLGNLIKKAQEQKRRFFIMELSSIGMKEKRLEGLLFQTIILTNITSDHLDYHHSLEDYQMTKISFINNQVAKKFIYASNNIVAKINKPFVFVNPLTINNNNLVYQKGKNHYLIKNMPLYNASNLSLALAVASYYNVSFSNIKRVLKKIKRPLGRSQLIKQNPRIIIDYAHTASALETILKEEYDKKKGKIFVLFGSGGDRDKTKRPLYGDIVYKYADYALVSNDNPRYEDPLSIVHDIISHHPSFFHIELDRKIAIKRIMMLINKNDTFLLIGKGHEDYQLIKDYKIYLNDCEEVQKWLKVRKY